jgi:hypothetical protein
MNEFKQGDKFVFTKDFKKTREVHSVLDLVVDIRDGDTAIVDINTEDKTVKLENGYWVPFCYHENYKD